MLYMQVYVHVVCSVCGWGEWWREREAERAPQHTLTGIHLLHYKLVYLSKVATPPKVSE